MAMTTMVTGKIYNGKVYTWTDKKKKTERSMFRGRLNYRDRTNGEWYFVDVVCWKDFGDTGGLVAFLEKHFSANSDNAPADKGGQPIEVVGYFEPTEGEVTFPVKGKTTTKEFKVKHPTFQLVIETADFPPNNEKRAKANSGEVDDDFDFDEEDEFDLDEDDNVDEIDDEDDDDIEEEEEVETAKEKAARLKAEKAKKARADKAKAEKARIAAEAKKKKKLEEEEDDEFFEK